MSDGWFGEGEVKFFIDGDTKFPTINGTGTEDYFCGTYGFPEILATAYTGCTLKRGQGWAAEVESLSLAHHGSNQL